MADRGSPLAINTPVPGKGFNPYTKIDLASFEQLIQSNLKILLKDLGPVTVDTLKFSEFVRVSIRPQTGAASLRPPLVLDLAPGFKTPMGPAVEWYTRSGWSASFGPEGWIESPDQMRLHAPMEAFAKYIQASFNPNFIQKSPHLTEVDRFSRVVASGEDIVPHSQIPGGVMRLDPTIPHVSRAMMASEITFGLGEAATDPAQVERAIVNRAMLARTLLRAATPQEAALMNEEQFWAALPTYGYAFVKEGGRVRMRQAGIEIGPEQVQIVGADPNKAIKYINVAPGGGARSAADIIQIDPETGRPISMRPQPITGMAPGQRAGPKRILNVTYPGQEERPVAAVLPDVAFMAESLLSGSLVSYGDPFKGAVSAAYPKKLEPDLPQINAYQLEKAKWEWGRFQEIAGKPGEKVTYRRLDEKLPKAISPQESAIIGLLRYPELETNTEVIYPIRISAQDAPLYLTSGPEQAKLYVPPYFTPGVGDWRNMPEGKKTIETRLLAEGMGRGFQGQILPEAMSEIGMILPYHLETAAAIKGGGSKVVLSPALHPIGSPIREPVPGAPGRQLSGITGDVKVIEYSFIGHYGSLVPELQQQMLGLFDRINPDLAKELIRQNQEKAAELVEVYGQKTHGSPTSEEMAKVYAEKMGQPYLRKASAEQMFTHLRQLVEELPIEKSVGMFGWGNVPSQEYTLGSVPSSAKTMILRSLFRATRETFLKTHKIDIATQEGRRAFRQIVPGGWEAYRNEIISFEPETRGHLRGIEPEFRAAQHGPALIGTLVAPVVNEFLAGVGRVGPEEQRAMYVAWKEAAVSLGFDPESVLGASATGILPPAAEAWRNIAEVGRALGSYARIKPMPARAAKGEPARLSVTELTEQGRHKLEGFLATGVTDLTAIESFIQENLGQAGALYMPGAKIPYMVRPGWMEAVTHEAFSEGAQEPEPVQIMIKRYPELLQSWLSGYEPGTELRGEALLSEYQGWMESTFKSSSRTISKVLTQRYGGIMGRFAGLMLPVGESLMPEQQLETMLMERARASGVRPFAKSKEGVPWIAQAKEFIAQTGFLHGLTVREPAFQPMGGAQSGRIISERILKDRGLYLPPSTVVRPGGEIQPGSWMTTGWASLEGLPIIAMHGDWDADMIYKAGVAMLSQTGLTPLAGALRPPTGDTPIERRRLIQQVDQALRASTGGTPWEPGGSFNVLQKSLTRILQSVMSGKHGREAPPSAEGVTGIGISTVPWEELVKTSGEVIRTEQGMGTTYRMRQLFEAFATARGWSPEAITRGGTAQAYLYQTYLDKLTKEIEERRGFRNIETILSSAFFGEGRGGEFSLLYKPSAVRRHVPLWTAEAHKGVSDEERGRAFSGRVGSSLAIQLAEDIAGMETPDYGLAAFLTATKFEDIPQLEERMKKEGIVRALTGSGEGLMETKGYLYGRDITETLLGGTTVFSAFARDIGFPAVATRKGARMSKEEPGVPVMQRIGRQPIPWMGKVVPLRELGLQPDVSMAAGLFSYYTRRWGTTTPEFTKRFAPWPAEAMGSYMALKERLVSEGKPVPFMLDYMISQESVSALLRGVGGVEPATMPRLTSAEAARFVPGKMTVGSTTVPFLAMPGKLGIMGQSLYTEELAYAKQKELELVASQATFGIEPEKLRPASEAAFQKKMFEAGYAFEEQQRGELFKRERMFLYDEQGRPIVGPLYGIPHEKQGIVPAAEIAGETYTESPFFKTYGRFAPDVLGLVFEKGKENVASVLQASMKWSLTPLAAEQKPASLFVRMQEAQYFYPLQARAFKGSAASGPLRELLEPQIRETPWFKEFWSFEGQKAFAESQKLPVPSEEMMRAQQEQIIRRNIKLWSSGLRQSTLGIVPYRFEAFSGWGEPGAYQVAGGPEGVEIPGVREPLLRRYIAKGFMRGQQLMAPENIAEAMPQIAAAAFEAGTPFTELGPAFLGLQGATGQWKEWVSRYNVALRPTTIPGAKPTGMVKAQLGYQGGEHEPRPGENMPPAPGEGTTINVESGEQVVINPASSGAGAPPHVPPIAGASAGGMNDFANLLGQKLTEALQQTGIGIYHAAGGGTSPVLQDLRAVEGVLSMQGMNTPQFRAWGAQMQTMLEGILGLPAEQQGRYQVMELAQMAKTGAPEQQAAFRTLIQANRPTIQSGYNVLQTVGASYRAALKGTPMSGETMGALASLMGLTEQEVREQISGGLALSPELGTLAGSLRTAHALQTTASDWRTTAKTRGFTEANIGEHLDETGKKIKGLGEVVVEATEKLSSLNKQFASATSETERLAISQEAQVQKGVLASALGQERLVQARGTLKYLQAARVAGAEVTPEAWGQASAEVLAAEQQVVSGEQAQAYGRQPWLRRALGQGQAGRFMRGLIGGWGLMYMGHLASFPMQTWQYGYQESEQFQMQMAAQAGATLGPSIRPWASPTYAALQTQIAYGAPMAGAAQLAGARIPGGARDIFGAGLASLSAGAMALYFGSVGAQAGLTGLTTAMNTAAVPAMALGLLGGLSLTQAAYNQFPEQNILALGTSQVRQQRETNPLVQGLLGLDVWWRSLNRPEATQAATQYTQAVNQTLTSGAFSAQQISRGPQGYFIAPQRGGAPTAQQMYTVAQRIAADPRFSDLDPNLVGQVALQLLPTGQATENNIRQMVTALAAGTNVPAIAQAVQQFTGGGYQPPAALGALQVQISGMQPRQLARLQRGLELMGRTPGIQQWLGGGAPISAQAVQGLAEGAFAGIQGGAYEAPFLQRAGIAAERFGLGLTTPVNLGLYQRQRTWTPQQWYLESQRNALLNRGAALGGQLATAGVPYETMLGVTGWAELSPANMGIAERVRSMDRFAVTGLAAAGAIGNQYATMDIGLGGNLTGYQLFATSLQQGTQTPIQTANQLLPTGWQNRPGAQAMVYGINVQTGQVYQNAAQRQAAIQAGVPASQIVGGLQGGQWQQQWAGWNYQAATSGINLAQIALQEKYQPLFWNIEDRQRALQDRQMAWSFQMQGQQLGMQRSQFYENFALNMQGTQMQRQFTMRDWAWQNQMRQMQWGWRQEDFAENVRFMTGRERRLAERQMERETTMFGMEGTRIDEQRRQQKELWALEDQRFELQRKHFEEQFKLSEENLKKQKEFYEEQKKLRDEQTKLQRAYWKEQIELQKQAAGASATYAEAMKTAALDMELISKGQGDVLAGYQVAAASETEMINTLIKGLNHIIKNAPDALASIVDALAGGGTKLLPEFTGGGKKDKTPKSGNPRQIGGPHMPGVSVIGEGGRELLESSVPMHVYPNNELKSMLYGSQSNYTSYWNNSYVDLAPPQRGGQGGPAVLIVNIGNERLGRFVIEKFDKALEVG